MHKLEVKDPQSNVEAKKEEVTFVGVNQAMLNKETNIYYASFKCIESVGRKRSNKHQKLHLNVSLKTDITPMEWQGSYMSRKREERGNKPGLSIRKRK